MVYKTSFCIVHFLNLLWPDNICEKIGRTYNHSLKTYFKIIKKLLYDLHFYDAALLLILFSGNADEKMFFFNKMIIVDWNNFNILNNLHHCWFALEK